MSNKLTTFEQFKMFGNKVKGFVDNQISNLAGLTSTAISDLQSGKQDKLTGEEGQVVGFGSDGNVVNFNGPINPNLLDNSNFKVNQRRQSTYTEIGHSVDRWRITESLTINSDSVTAKGGVIQKLETLKDLFGKTLTFSVLTAEDLYTGTGSVTDINTQVWFVPRTNNIGLDYNPFWSGFQIDCFESKELIAAKLELGDHQTLAHQDSSGNWVLNEIPNYALDLMKCQRHQLITNTYYSPYSLTAISTNTLVGSIVFPVQMRVTPTLTDYCFRRIKDGLYINTSYTIVSGNEQGIIGIGISTDEFDIGEQYQIIGIFDANL